ncbi:MAG: DUF2834 domain-containing protein [Rhodobiaceae bacterium]|nr:DUF2834 domain-containing protein [Rhodobiaceae bacterium]
MSAPKRRTRKWFYLLATVAGTLLPLSQFLPWLSANGLDIPLFFDDLFVNGVAGFFGLDVIISAIVLLLFIQIEGKRVGLTKLWLPITGTLLVGISCGLPMFLYLREAKLEQMKGNAVDRVV